jgi:hypothetical protein
MIRNLLVCGMAAGLIAGLFAAGTATLVGEPSVDQAIDFEEAQSQPATQVMRHGVVAQGSQAAEESPPVPRALQKTGGLLTALLLYGVALGGLFALVFAFVYGRVARVGPQVTAYWLAAACFVVVYLVPFLKYPANPPSVGDPETIGQRTALYGLMLAISLVGALAALRLRRDLSPRIGGHASTVLAVGAYVLAMVTAGVALPGIHEVPTDFPATTLWHFREASVAVQATVWTALGLVFGYASPRVLAAKPLLTRTRRASAAAARP